MTPSTQVCCPTCKKQTAVEISEAQFAQMRKEVALKQKRRSHDARQDNYVANSEVRFSSTGGKGGSSGNHKNRIHRNEHQGRATGVTGLVFDVLIHCSGCDNLYTHQIPMHSPIEAEPTQRSSKSYSAPNAHSRLYSVITNERENKSTESTKFTDSTVETLTQHFDAFTMPNDVSSTGVSNSGLSILGLKSSGTGENGPTDVRLSTIAKKGLKIMVETTSFKLLLPSAVALVGMMAMSMSTNSVVFQMLNAIWPPEHRVPESSIYIEGTRADEIKVTNGKKFIAVTGTVRNDGTHSVHDVIIQGLIYKADGVRLHDAIGFAHKAATMPSSSQAPSSKALTDAEITAIERSEIGQILNPTEQESPKVITDIGTIAQSNYPKRERELKAGQSQDFTIYIPVEENQQKADLLYSARIFAVS